MKRNIDEIKGEFLGAYAPYGYILDENRCFLKDDYAAKIINTVFDMFINGATMREIARKMTFDGVDTPAGYHYKNGLIRINFEEDTIPIFCIKDAKIKPLSEGVAVYARVANDENNDLTKQIYNLRE